MFIHVHGDLSGQSFFVSIRSVGTTEICQGDSVEARFWFFGGTSPYTVTINNDEGEYVVLNDIEPSYTFYLKPVSDDTYYISSAFDSNGNQGRPYGSVSVKVNPSTPVSIVTDRTAFLVTEPGFPLTSNPPGATFSGKGISGSTFYPSDATPVGSPHLITCTYVNKFGCVSEDNEDFFVLSGECSVSLYSGSDIIYTVCDPGATYTIKGSNEDNLSGTFELFKAGSSNAIPGHILDDDLNDNEATLLVTGLTGEYEIVYTYGMEALEISASTDFLVVDIGIIGIQNLPDNLCESDPPFQLVPEVDSEDPGATFTFSGPGVSGNPSDGFYFDPGDPNVTPGLNMIYLLYTSSHGCRFELSLELPVGFTPVVNFEPDQICIASEGSMISFTNLTSQKDLIALWSWDFGDPASGANNTSNLENPEHFYTEPGSKTIVLGATTDAGCHAQHQIETLMVDQPVVDFTWDNDCYAEDQVILFRASLISNYAELDTLIWTIRSTEGALLEEIGSGPDEFEFEYLFSSADQYDITLSAENTAGCRGELTRRFDLLPVYVLASEVYMETFDDAVLDWKVASVDQLESWILGEPEFAGFDQTENDFAWYTDLPVQTEDYLEYSWVRSPCFDFSGLNHPLIQLDIMKSFRPGMDGAVLQYQDLISEGWKTLGVVGEGLNWYNDTAIYHKPGGSSMGWGLDAFEPDQEWIPASHSLEVLAGYPRVKFRLAVATGPSEEITPGGFNQGFAFDNILIKEAILKRSVLEYFTNAAGASIYPADSLVESFAKKHSGIVYDLHYHMDYPDQDPMNAYNPYPPSTRAFNYGVPDVPYAVLNGGVTPEYRFDLSASPEELNDEVLLASSLETPLFELSLSVDYQENRLEGNATVVCLADNFSSYLQLYIVVIEQEVTSYPLLTPDSSFRNVVLDMLPSPAGKLLGNLWGSGTMVEQDFSWDYVDYLEDIEDLCVVAFVQDRDNGWILQANALPKTPLVGIPGKDDVSGSFILYPNPARDRLTINFEDATEPGGQLIVVDLSGLEVMNADIQQGTTMQHLDISRLPAGMFMVIWKEFGIVKGQAKLIRYR